MIYTSFAVVTAIYYNCLLKKVWLTLLLALVASFSLVQMQLQIRSLTSDSFSQFIFTTSFLTLKILNSQM